MKKTKVRITKKVENGVLFDMKQVYELMIILFIRYISLVLFFINIISSIILILKKTHQELKIHRNRTYKEVFRDQIHQHKHLLIAPLVLILLAIPRLILTYLSKCMESDDDIWLYLVGYFISFLPSMMSFLVFVMPSKFYKKEFRKTIDQYRKVLRTLFESPLK